MGAARKRKEAVGTPPEGLRRLPADAEAEAREAVQSGDVRRALTVLMACYGNDIFRHVRQVVGDAAMADDVHQTVFVQAYRDLPSFAGRSSFRTWLYGIARHRCLDALKQKRRWRSRFAQVVALPDPADARPLASERMQAGDRSAALVRCLERLKPKARIAVLLRYQEGMAYDEMAIVCGEQPATLQARVSRAVTRMRGWMEDNDGV